MKSDLLRKEINNIKLSRTNPELSFLASKKSFSDRNLSSFKDVIMEISNIGKKEFGIKSESFYKSLIKSDENEFISLDNGIFLINSLYEQIKENCLIFLRLKKPVLYNNDYSMDIIFALITPKNIKTSNKLQILSKLTRMLKKPNIRKKIKGAEKAEDVLALLLVPS